jgi:hypothetical protein
MCRNILFLSHTGEAMAVVVTTKAPNSLLTAIKAAIDENRVETWEYDGDGDFTHTPPQWRNNAWLRPFVENGVLRFGILGQKNVAMSAVVYGVYHGRFIEMLLSHFDTKFSTAAATALKSLGDNFDTSSVGTGIAASAR